MLDPILILQRRQLRLFRNILVRREYGADGNLACLCICTAGGGVAGKEDSKVIGRAGVLLEDAVEWWCTIYVCV